MYTEFINGWGLDGTGKTWFGLNGTPRPVHHLNFDRSAAALYKELPDRDQIIDTHFVTSDTTTRSGALAVLAELQNQAAYLRKLGRGTFFIDGGDAFKDVVRLAKLPDGDTDLKKYEIVNEWIRRELLLLEASAVQVYIVHPATRIWESATRESERVKSDQWKHLGKLVTTTLYFFTPGAETELLPAQIDGQALNPDYAAIRPRFMVKVLKCKYNPYLQGQIHENLTFPIWYATVFGEMLPSGPAAEGDV